MKIKEKIWRGSGWGGGEVGLGGGGSGWMLTNEELKFLRIFTKKIIRGGIRGVFGLGGEG